MKIQNYMTGSSQASEGAGVTRELPAVDVLRIGLPLGMLDGQELAAKSIPDTLAQVNVGVQ